MGPGRKMCVVPHGTKTTKVVVEGLIKVGMWSHVARKSRRDFKGFLCAYTNIPFIRTTQILRP